MNAKTDNNAGIRPVLGAIAVVVRADQILLVRRKKEPDAGKWGFPGGHVEAGETALAAAARELAEETSVQAAPQEYLTNLDIIMRDDAGHLQFHYLLAVVLCHYTAGEPVAADDVSEAGWFTMTEIAALPKSDKVEEVVRRAMAHRNERS